MKIENMKVINKGSIKAFFTVDLVKVKINKCKLIQQDGQAAFFSGPDEKYTAKDGTTKYMKLVFFEDKTLQEKITQMAVAEYQKHCAPASAAPAMDAEEDLPF